MPKKIVIPSSLEMIKNLSSQVDGFIIGIQELSVNLPVYVENLEEVISLIKSYEKEIFVSLNKNMHNSDLPLLKETYINTLYKLKGHNLDEISPTTAGEEFIYYNEIRDWLKTLSVKDVKKIKHQTNLTLLNRERILELKQISDKTGVKYFFMPSIDGLTKETYEATRVGGKFDVVIQNLKDLVDVFGVQNVKPSFTIKETNITESYITILTYVSTAIVLLSNILIYAIIATKKKTSIYHLVGSIYYIIVLIVLFFLAGALQSIADHAMDATFANFVRDTATISSLPGYVMLIWGFVDAIGFNIKTFRIDNHVELKVSEDDEDDIEIKVGSDNNTIKRNGVHFVRELKYYVLENKFVFTCIFIVLALIVGYTTYSNYQLYNKTYTINQNFTLDNFSISVKDSYITNVDYRGALINSGKYYLAIKIGIHNQTARDTAIERSNFRIYIGDEIIYPSYDKSSRFIDIGKMYLGEVIAAGSSDDYVFVYELTKDQVKSSYEMRILNGLTQKKEKLLTKYKKISIKPQNILKTQEIGEAKTKQQLDLSNTTLGETTFKLNKSYALDQIL